MDFTLGSHPETAKGVPIYDGNASQFHTWQFKTTLAYKASKKEDLPKTLHRIVEGLRGDALQVARDIGEAELAKDKGIEVLIDKIKDVIVFLSLIFH